MALEPITLYKLIVLYMLDRVDFPLSNGTITEFMLESGYTDFATTQQVIGIIQDDNLIHAASNRRNTSYTLTDEGRDMLEYFGNKISDEIKKEVNEFLSRNKYELKQAANITSEMYQTGTGDYAVHCAVRENNSNLIDLTLSVPDADMAGTMCDNWRERSQEIYEFIMRRML